MEYVALDKSPYYADCEKIVSHLGYSLVSLKITPMKGRTQVQIVIAFKDSSVTEGIGIDDCAKVHRLLAERMEELLPNEDVYMEVTSPGMERNIKNAAEFSLFVNKNVKIYNTEISNWIEGTIIFADDKLVRIRTADSEKEISFENIAKAKLIYL